MTVHRDKFLVKETNRLTESQFYWYYDSSCFGQPLCPSLGLLSRKSALVQDGTARSSSLLLVANGHQIWKNVPMPMYG